MEVINNFDTPGLTHQAWHQYKRDCIQPAIQLTPTQREEQAIDTEDSKHMNEDAVKQC